MLLVNIHENNTQTLTEQLESLAKLSSSLLHLRIDFIPKNEQFLELKEFINNNDLLPFVKLSLPINLAILQNPLFLKLIEKLNQYVFRDLILLFKDEEIQTVATEIENLLTTSIAPIAAYPIHASPGLSLQKFQAIIIANIQQKNNTQRDIFIPSALEKKRYVNPNDILAKPIRLKTFIAQNTKNPQSLSEFIQLEVQHIEAVNQEIAIEEIIEEQIQAEISQLIEIYTGDLLGFNEFSSPFYKEKVTIATGSEVLTEELYLLLRQELFANLPHAIKYLSKEAAVQLADNLPSLVTFNKRRKHTNNLPPGFIIKQTKDEEWVLDYDAFADNDQQSDDFILEISNIDTDFLPIYDISLNSHDLRAWLADEELADKIIPHQKRLVNLWIKYADKGVSTFVKTMLEATSEKPQLFDFLLQHYLVHFPQWDCFFNDQTFFSAVQRASSFEKNKLDCLKKFLINTGSSRHALAQTVTTFDAFWNEILLLCLTNQAESKYISDATWETPKGGNPVVYMDRLLCILKNARCFKEQCQSLDNILLDNYGAYYASEYEGFTFVSQEMALHYDPVEQDGMPFNKYYNLYRIQFETLFEWWLNHQKYVYFTHKFDRLNFMASYDSDDESPSLNDSNYSTLKKRHELFDLGHIDEFDFPLRLYFRLSTRTPNEDYILWLTEKPKPLSMEMTYILGYRVLGSQTTGITVNVYKAEFQKFYAEWKAYGFQKIKKSPCSQEEFQQFKPPIYLLSEKAQYRNNKTIGFYSKAPKEMFSERDLTEKDFAEIEKMFSNQQQTPLLPDEKLLKLAKIDSLFNHRVDATLEFISALFFCMHERYQGNNLANLFSAITRYDYDQNPNYIDSTSLLLIQEVSRLNRLDIKLNEREGIVLFDSSSTMTFDGWDRMQNCTDYPRLARKSVSQLISHLQENKFGTFKFLQTVDLTHWPLVFVLDSAEVLAQDSVVADFYRDDLLLIAYLINKRDRYFHEESKESKENGYNALLQIQRYLHLAATGNQNLQYAFQCIINSVCATPYFYKFQEMLETILSFQQFDPQAVEICLKNNDIQIAAKFPSLQFRDTTEFKQLVIQLILVLKDLKSEPTLEVNTEQDDITFSSLMRLSMPDLQQTLQKLWGKSGALLTIMQKQLFASLLIQWRNWAIKQAFSLEDPLGILPSIIANIHKIPEFQECQSFEKIDFISKQASKLAILFSSISTNNQLEPHQNELIKLLSEMDFSVIEYETLFAMLSFLQTMPNRDYFDLLSLFSGILQQKSLVLRIVNDLINLQGYAFPTDFMHSYAKLVVTYPDANISLILAQLIALFKEDHQDPLLVFILRQSSLSPQAIEKLLTLTKSIHLHREAVRNLLLTLCNRGEINVFLDNIHSSKALEIIVIGHKLNKNKHDINNIEFAKLLNTLSTNNLSLLYDFYNKSPVSVECLFSALKYERPADFNAFLLAFEKAPFGQRNFSEQFSCNEVERVINKSHDLLNDSPYTFAYRKQLLEAFLLVNEIGNHLPVYYNKPAKSLSNAEIKAYFASLKNNDIPNLTLKMRRLLALGLLRECMYRCTSEFPYSTQIISIIDAVLHQGDYVSNIDTGQGKSLIDLMKAALLWLDSDRVDYTTSSLVDARKDIENYSLFFEFLNIPFSKTPITSSSNFESFQTKGINISTFAQISLFFAKAKVAGVCLDRSNTIISAIINESDYAILDDRVIYRFASYDGVGIGYQQEWIYEAINEFTHRDEFITDLKRSADEDINDLKAYLKLKAISLKKSYKFIDKHSDEQYLSWIESSLMVQYVLKENSDYIISEQMESKVVNGCPLHSKVTKILMDDYKVSPDSTYGNGMQQLLYAYLNSLRGTKEFVIEPQTKTIVSSINKTLLQYYLAHRGYIWCSSGTVGSAAEVHEQKQKYGFNFSKIEPHQKNQVQYHKPIIAADENTQIGELINILIKDDCNENSRPSLVFCEDIDSAKNLYALLSTKDLKKHSIQCYTGLGKEEDYIKQAATKGMITISTSALGRNTNILYSRIIGMNVYHMSVDSIRLTRQKSGRTGREGSPGDIYFILNAQKLLGQSIEQIQKTLDEDGARERAFNEELYDILNCFMAKIDALPYELFIRSKPEFLRLVWSKFNTETETAFMQSYRNGLYDKDRFIEERLAAFTKMMSTELNSPITISLNEINDNLPSRKAAEMTKYVSLQTPVTLQDGMSAIIHAYSFIRYEGREKIDDTAIKHKLNELFKDLNEDNFLQRNRDYLQFLTTLKGAHTRIVNAHRKFLQDYLTQHLDNSLNFLQKLVGIKTTLIEVLENPYIILMFHAFSNLSSEPLVSIGFLKNAVVKMLDKYLQRIWSEGSQPKRFITILKAAITQVNNIQHLIQSISYAQVTSIKIGIKNNENYSNYNSTLSLALLLVTSLAGKSDVMPLIERLSTSLNELTQTDSKTSLNYDEFEQRLLSINNSNAMTTTLANSLKYAYGIQSRQLAFKSMFFTSHIRKVNAQLIKQEGNALANTAASLQL